VLVLYPIAMTFSLVYSGEHYLSDCLAGALVAVVVAVIADRVEARLMAAGVPPERMPDVGQMPEPVSA
jgi:membrane-associated phospholipid phosphatase